MNKREKKLANFFDKLAHFIINFHFYFYFIISILIIVLYFLNLTSLFNILFIIMMVIYVIELSMGLDRNFLGIVGIIILGSIGYIVTKNISGAMLGITIGILFVNILKLILSHLINKISRRV